MMEDVLDMKIIKDANLGDHGIAIIFPYIHTDGTHSIHTLFLSSSSTPLSCIPIFLKKTMLY